MTVATVESWFDRKGWSVMDYQREVWSLIAQGRSGLVHSATGTGKTQALWLGVINDAIERGETDHSGLRVLWITPLRALATDTTEALRDPVRFLDLPWTVEKRTGDTSSSIKQRQLRKPPTCLVTTPESATLMLSRADASRVFRKLDLIVVDKWHELIGTKRGVQTELALSRLRALSPNARIWGLSATLGNTDEAMRVLMGAGHEQGVLVTGPAGKIVTIDTLLPPDGIDRFPWAGHLGVTLVDGVIDEIKSAGTTLIFTNTRSQAELWFRAIQKRDPSLVGAVAIHHGSLDRDIRREVESMLRAPETARTPLRCVVCTSSLDLGVDFSPVDLVIQIGSPKGVARLAQRAGRSGHRPGEVSRIVGVPTHAMELIEFAAARRALDAGELESREPLNKPLDVLSQHAVTAAAGGGFVECELLEEVRATHAYRDLTDREWAWVMDFCRSGSRTLGAYPHFSRITPSDDSPERYVVPSRKLTTTHRLGIGTIVGDEGVLVRYMSGRTLGTIEESFVSRLRQGQRFIFAGRPLIFERLRDMTAWVRRATSPRGAVPRWQGGRMPLSTQLASSTLEMIERALDGQYDEPEMRAIRPLIEQQARDSTLPSADSLLIEQIDIRGSRHFFLYSFAGRLAHEGLGALLSFRLSARSPVTVRASGTDHGIELQCESELDIDDATWREILSTERLADDLIEAVNAAQLARRHFREIARIAGLTQQGYPGQRARTKYLQASSEMFYDVFEEFDPENMLLEQARREVLESQLEFVRLRNALESIEAMSIRIERPDRLTPMSFPIWAESLRSTLVSSETWEDRVRRMAESLEARAST